MSGGGVVGEEAGECMLWGKGLKPNSEARAPGTTEYINYGGMGPLINSFAR